MGNVECTLCKTEKNYCKLCGRNYCLLHDVVKNDALDRYCILHEKGFPCFGDNTAKEMTHIQKKYASGKSSGTYVCPGSGIEGADCMNVANHKCANFACCGFFCEEHKTHEHLKCQYGTCSFPALVGTVSEKVYCEYHHNILVNPTYGLAFAPTYTQTPSYGNCYDCGKLLTHDRASIHYCVTCNGKWQALKKQGIRGPFG